MPPLQVRTEGTLIYCMEFQSSPSPYILSPRGEGRGEGANLPLSKDMKMQTVNRQEKKRKLLDFLEAKKEERKTISRKRKEAILAAEKEKEKIRLRASIKKEFLQKEKGFSVAKAAISRIEKKEKLLQFIKERKEKFARIKNPRRKISLTAKPLLFLTRIKKIPKTTILKAKEITKKTLPAKKTILAVPQAPIKVSPAAKSGERATKPDAPISKKAAKKEIAVSQKIEWKPFLRRYTVKIFFFLLLLAWAGEIIFFGSKIYFRKEKPEDIIPAEKQLFSQKKSEKRETEEAKVFAVPEIKIAGERDPFSNDLFRMEVLMATRKPEVIPFKSIIKPEVEKPVEIPPLIPEGEKISSLARVERPEVTEISLPKPVCPLKYRGSLEIAGMEYLFVEGEKNHQATIGDIIEGYRLFNKVGDIAYLSKDGNIFQISKQTLSCPLHYRGRLIMDGKEYLFLEGKRTYRVLLGESAEEYQVIRRIGNILYLLKDNNIFELKEE